MFIFSNIFKGLHLYYNFFNILKAFISLFFFFSVAIATFLWYINLGDYFETKF